MSASASPWPPRLIAAVSAVVILVGAFAISGRSSGNGKPKIHPGSVLPPAAATTPSPRHHPSSPTASPVPANASPSGSTQPSAAATAAASTTSAPKTIATSATATSSAQPRSAAVPAGVLGTFSYATSGSEQTSIPGTKRSYPATTTISNVAKGCGVESTWKPVPQHVQSQEVCPDGKSLKVTSYATTISFFGINSGEDFSCSGDSYIYQPGVTAGHVWTYQCKSSDAKASQVAHVVGYPTLTVGGKSVRVLDVRVDTTLTGADAGKSTQEYWMATSSPVLVKETGTVDATQQNVHYQETYSLTLNDLTPKT